MRDEVHSNFEMQNEKSKDRQYGRLSLSLRGAKRRSNLRKRLNFKMKIAKCKIESQKIKDIKFVLSNLKRRRKYIGAG